MVALWLTPNQNVRLDTIGRMAHEEGWHAGPTFLRSDATHVELSYQIPDGTCIAIYHPGADVVQGGERAIAVYGKAPERVATRIARRLGLSTWREEPVFRRWKPLFTAACAAPDGVWFVASERGELCWQAEPDGPRRVVARGLSSAAALVGDASALYALSCDDPQASGVARIDPATGEVAWIATLAGPTQLAMLGRTLYAVDDAGLVRIAPDGALTRIATPSVWMPDILMGSPDGLAWIDRSAHNIIWFDGAKMSVIASGQPWMALDIDGDRLYALSSTHEVHELRRGRRFAFGDAWSRGAGVLRVGAVLVTALEREDSYRMVTRCDLLPIGLPMLDDAPPALVADAHREAAACEVLADWLMQRGVAITPHSLGDLLGMPLHEGYETDERPAALPGRHARLLVTYDRETAYLVCGDQLVHVITARHWY